MTTSIYISASQCYSPCAIDSVQSSSSNSYNTACVQLSSVLPWPFYRLRRTLCINFLLFRPYSSLHRLSSPLEQVITSAPTPAPTCTLTVLKQPPLERICTDYSKTVTYIAYTECGSCALVTKRLGVGLVNGSCTSMVETVLMVCSPVKHLHTIVVSEQRLSQTACRRRHLHLHLDSCLGLQVSDLWVLHRILRWR
jgi:hypothetical protein